MPTTILGGFNQLRQNLEITDLQAATVSTRQKNVREAVEKEMTVVGSYLAGSYARSTMIGPLSKSDVDIFVILDASYFEKYKPTALLDRVRTGLLKTDEKEPRVNGKRQAVNI